MTKKTKPHKWTDEQIEFFKQNVKGTKYKDLKDKINNEFGLDLTIEQVRGFAKRNQLLNGRDSRFKKGNPSWCKGMKGVNFSGGKGRFKKGHRPHNYKPVGYERINEDGYVLIKVSDTGAWHERWRFKHRVLWEKANGPIPEGHAIIFGDGDKTNVSIDNLILVSKSQLSVMNRKQLIKNDVELTKVGATIAELELKINEVSK